MDIQQAIRILLTAGLCSSSMNVSAAEGVGGAPAQPPAAASVKKPLTQPRVAGKQFPAVINHAIAVLRPLYGIMPRDVTASGDLEKMTSFATEVREALSVVAAPEARSAAEKAGLTDAKLTEIRGALDSFVSAIEATRAVQVLQPMYGILVRQVTAKGELLNMKRTAAEVSEALEVVQRAENKETVARSNLKPERITEVRQALVQLNAAIAKHEAKKK